jgi:hypothetical protein
VGGGIGRCVGHGLGSRGRPSACSPMMLRWTWLEPP